MFYKYFLNSYIKLNIVRAASGKVMRLGRCDFTAVVLHGLVTYSLQIESCNR